jgi:aldose 1-epimerase
LFEIKHIQDLPAQLNYLEIINPELALYGKINLKNGGSLERFVLNKKELITSSDLNYETYYNSAILFPFVNRIRYGRYTFEDLEYQLPLNKPEEGNSIHGLVYNKTFEVIKTDCTNTSLIITIGYKEHKGQPGFPFKYSIYVTYTFLKDSLELSVEVVNDDVKSFPFTLGWHPYFKTGHSDNCNISIDGYSEIKFDSELNFQFESIKDSAIELASEDFDTCYQIHAKKFNFNTADYSFELVFDSNDKFLQLYTPKNKNLVAIEPQTGIANSFNNGIGLKVLKPSESYHESWKINLIQTN